MQDKLFTVERASEEFSIDKNLIYYWIRKGKFRYFKEEKRILFYKSDFVDFIEQNIIEPDSYIFTDNV